MSENTIKAIISKLKSSLTNLEAIIESHELGGTPTKEDIATMVEAAQQSAQLAEEIKKIVTENPAAPAANATAPAPSEKEEEEGLGGGGRRHKTRKHKKKRSRKTKHRKQSK